MRNRCGFWFQRTKQESYVAEIETYVILIKHIFEITDIHLKLVNKPTYIDNKQTATSRGKVLKINTQKS